MTVGLILVVLGWAIVAGSMLVFQFKADKEVHETLAEAGGITEEKEATLKVLNIGITVFALLWPVTIPVTIIVFLFYWVYGMVKQ